MKKIILFVIVLNSMMFLTNKEAFSQEAIEKVFEGIFGATLGEPEYTFRPGDKIVDLEDGILYYSGYEESGTTKTLLFTLLTTKGPVLLKFPNPDIIQIKTLKLKVKSFNNTYLVIEKISHTISE